ncbi:MAG: excinuclease ABC subunit UvrC [Corynebacterium pyruviciproducens]|uniref:excinuclease ABC subunit UvrC n=1 Tax=Corynebacterium pyruviciproducens TaxID=598660 RepID=UPI00254E1B58|nr:excinuclease ABC subunit UvrC [Corynebacterium pyruviciproducens]MDK6565995.1 excinuclease ABC subunit UvrC [Corynebacterium pyruviciproducens]
MANPLTYRPAPGTIPEEPGVYKFRDAHKTVIYVGKAKNLRARLANYFQPLHDLHPRTRQMVTTGASVEWTVVASEVEALQLEYTWIKKFDPKFNVQYRDDKTYPMLAVSLKEQYPRAFVYRGPRRKGVRYFGPYSHAWAIRETLDLLTRVFPMRTCAKGVFNRQRQLERPCLLGYIEKCSAPCIGRVTAEEHREIVDGFCRFMAGQTDVVTRRLKQEMADAAAALDFEKAARLRDNLKAISKAMERQSVVFGDGTDADLIAFAVDDLEAAVQIFHVRGGRIRGQRGWVVEKEGDEDVPELMQGFLMQFYNDASRAGEETAVELQRRGVDQLSHVDVNRNAIVPREVLVQQLPLEVGVVASQLEQLRGAGISLRVPQRGEKRELMEVVERNAKEALKQHKLKRVGDLTARSAAIEQLKEYLEMDEAPLRIECTDISHIQGTDVVASLVVFEDGLPKKSDYRRYIIRDQPGNDVASIAEVTRRRFKRYNEDKLDMPEDVEFTDAEAQKRFAYPPQLFIVDGGLPQVHAAAEVFEELGITDVKLIGLAKRLEEVWIPDDDDPVILPRSSEGLYLLQHVRDEAHRFAITFHRQKRSKRLRVSELDSIRGLGNQRKSDLVRHFGSVKRLKEAAVEDITEVKGIGPKLAQSIFDALHPDAVRTAGATPAESE